MSLIMIYIDQKLYKLIKNVLETSTRTVTVFFYV
jgi:hypothetical protein